MNRCVPIIAMGTTSTTRRQFSMVDNMVFRAGRHAVKAGVDYLDGRWI
jgi:hypothetical protein